MLYDIIIVGAGIAGLYAGYKIHKNNPNVKILILEQNERSKIGGRMGTVNFHSVDISTGAGVGRKAKDVLLNQLLHDLKINTHEFTASASYASTIQPKCNVSKIFNNLKTLFKKNPKRATFEQFSKLYLSKDEYEHFVTCSGYSDYENEEARATFYDYGFEDNYQKWTAVSIPWNKLITALVKEIGSHRIVCNQTVSKILYNSECNLSEFDIITSNEKYTTKHVILATTIDSVIKLLPQHRSLYKQIHGQPFLRVYAKMSKNSLDTMREKLPQTTIVVGPMHKMIPINADKGIYMIVYTDNRDANKLKSYSENNQKNREYMARSMERALGFEKHSLEIDDMMSFYWKIGTHYYEPLGMGFKDRSDFLRQAQNPRNGIYVIGEMVSTNQGWVEGALESVESLTIR